ncbi:hypothetical protein [Mariniflexile sp. HMF6888]|uniref:hypothetical protein n=1 Tax=Mariniflexile sp. HMF6888 TaxID=3373086 RepID=UPI00379ACE2B
MSGILFVFWKSELSQPIFDFAHSYGIGMNRTVDYSDLFALTILPISYKYWNSYSRQILEPKRALKPIIITICSISFIATTLPKHYEKISLKSEFSTDIKSEYQNVRNQLNLYKEGLFEKDNYRIELPEKRAHILTSIKVDSINENTTKIVLDSILSFTVEGNGFIFSSGIKEKDVDYIRNLKQSEIEKLFSEQIKNEFE